MFPLCCVLIQAFLNSSAVRGVLASDTPFSSSLPRNWFQSRVEADGAGSLPGSSGGACQSAADQKENRRRAATAFAGFVSNFSLVIQLHLCDSLMGSYLFSQRPGVLIQKNRTTFGKVIRFPAASEQFKWRTCRARLLVTVKTGNRSSTEKGFSCILSRYPGLRSSYWLHLPTPLGAVTGGLSP